jgi:hypothetical protein
MEIPASLRRWFGIHAIVDLLIGLPLLVAPETLLRTLGWITVDPLSARLVGAALLAIGLQSWVGRRAAVETYRAMLNLKLIWSAAAIGSLLVAIGSGAPGASWVFLALFIAFFGIWFYYRVRIKQISRMNDMPDHDDLEPDRELDGQLDGDDDEPGNGSPGPKN